MQIPLEVILGPLGAVGVLLWWNYDLRKQRDDFRERLFRILDKIEVAPKTEPPR